MSVNEIHKWLKVVVATFLAMGTLSIFAINAFADTGSNGNSNPPKSTQPVTGNGGQATETTQGKDNGVGNGGTNQGGGKGTTQVPETPYALILPAAALGVVVFVRYQKNRKVV